MFDAVVGSCGTCVQGTKVPHYLPTVPTQDLRNRPSFQRPTPFCRMYPFQIGRIGPCTSSSPDPCLAWFWTTHRPARKLAARDAKTIRLSLTVFEGWLQIQRRGNARTCTTVKHHHKHPPSPFARPFCILRLGTVPIAGKMDMVMQHGAWSMEQDLMLKGMMGQVPSGGLLSGYGCPRPSTTLLNILLHHAPNITIFCLSTDCRQVASAMLSSEQRQAV